MRFKRLISVITVALMLFAPLTYAGLTTDVINAVGDKTVQISESIANALAVDAEVVSTGTCGEGLTWTLYKGNILEISGNGDMDPAYTAAKNYPWHKKRDVIRQIIIEDGVTNIGDYAFYECIKVTSVNVGRGVTSIGTASFAACEKLASVTLSDKLVSMSGSAFDNCPLLGSIAFPDTLVNISGPYFCGCVSLESITVGENNPAYSSDEYGVLYNKDKTTLIRYPAKGQKTEYTVPECVTAIERYAFWDSTTLASVVIPDNVKTIGEYAFSCCTALASAKLGDGVSLIDQYVFYGCSALTSIVIPDTVWSIGIHAFENCKSLEKIVIPNTVTQLGAWTFGNCQALKEVTIGDGIKTIPMRAFAYCTSLASLDMGSNVELVKEGAFEYCKALENVTFPSSVTAVEKEAFQFCTGLKSVTVPDNITSLGTRAFYTCSAIESVNIGNGIKTVSDELFYDCTSLESITFADSVGKIGAFSFAFCTALESVELPDSLTDLDTYAFYNCYELCEINVGASNKKYSSDENGVLFDKYQETLIQYPMGKTNESYKVPDSVYDIASEAFYGCTGIKKLIFGENVENIGAWAFGYCTELSVLQLGEWTYKIDDFAFYGCNKLQYVYCASMQEDWENVQIASGNEALTNAAFRYFEVYISAFPNEMAEPEFTAGVDAGKTVLQFKKDYSDRETYVFDFGGKAMLSDNDIVKTGYTVAVIENGNVIENKFIVVIGDSTGDGIVNGKDLIRLKKHILGDCVGYDEYADFNSDGKVDTSDVDCLMSLIK